ncbi:MAG: ATP-binding protein [Candidatus Parcubacteria bacterium]|nr:ATP-binding protein [Candidatus Parcubacteria bacterium]
MAIFSLAVAIAGFFTYLQTKEIIIEKTQGNLLIASDLRHQGIDNFFHDKTADYNVLQTIINEDLITLINSADQNLQTAAEQKIAKYFKDFLNNGELTEIFIMDKDEGKVIYSTDKNNIGKIKTNREYFIEGKKNTHIQKFFFSEDLQAPTAVIASPILDNNQKLIGVLASRLNLEDINKMMTGNSGLGMNGETYLLNSSNFFISQPSTSTDNLVFKKTVFTTAANECLAGKNNFGFYNDYRKKPVIGLYTWLPDDQLCLIAEIDQSEAFAPIYRFKNFVITIYLIILLGAILVIFLFTKTITLPLSELVKATKIISQGDLEYKININNRDEAGALAKSFNKMVLAIKESRAEVDNQVNAQTQEIRKKTLDIENQKKAILNILEDVSTERDLAGKERDETKTILKSIGDGVMVVDQQQKIEFINPVAEELTGWPLKDAIGINSETVFNIFDEEKMLKRQSPIDEAIKTGQIKNLSNHTVLKTKDGQIIPIADSAAPIKDAQGNISGAILVFRDVIKERISEEKLLMAKNDLEKLNLVLDQKVDQRTKELQKAYDELMSLDTMKDEFLNISAHELKTPLTSIIGLSEIMILNKQGSINIKQKKSLTIVNNEANRLLGIIKKILGITRIEAGKAVFDMQETDLCPLASKTVDSLKPLADKQKVELVCRKPNQAIWVKVDAERIQEVIYNLIDNALKFSPPESTIFISGEIKNNEFTFSVKDQGPGIDPAKKDKLFQKFSQLDTGFSRKQEGTGLGLYISKITIENMGGKIWVESEFGHGANFKFSLPLIKKN